MVLPRGWPLYIWVYEDLNPKMEKIMDFLNFFGFFQDFWIFWTLFGLFCKQNRIFPVFVDFGLIFVRLFWIFWIFSEFFNFWHRFFGVYENFIEWTTPRVLHLDLKINTNKELFRRVTYIILLIDSLSIFLRFIQHVSI